MYRKILQWQEKQKVVIEVWGWGSFAVVRSSGAIDGNVQTQRDNVSHPSGIQGKRDDGEEKLTHVSVQHDYVSPLLAVSSGTTLTGFGKNDKWHPMLSTNLSLSWFS